MIFYIDESGSLDNKHLQKPYFVISLIVVKNKKKLRTAFKRFIASNLDRLQRLDQEKTDANGKVLKSGNKMFKDGKFVELKGCQLDAAMKRKFIKYISRNNYFEVFLLRVDNRRLQDSICANTARGFNYIIKLALYSFLKNGLIPNEDCMLQLDERNEKTETRHFLENYLNTELTLSGIAEGNFEVKYFDSADNQFIQLADFFANWYYSHLLSEAYTEELDQLQQAGIIKSIFVFPI